MDIEGLFGVFCLLDVSINGRSSQRITILAGTNEGPKIPQHADLAPTRFSKRSLWFTIRTRIPLPRPILEELLVASRAIRSYSFTRRTHQSQRLPDQTTLAGKAWDKLKYQRYTSYWTMVR